MPSPFPGMDPYLEDPGLWPDVHHGLISQIQAVLNFYIRPKYVAGVETRIYISDDDDTARRVIVPDVRIDIDKRRKPLKDRSVSSGPALLEPPERIVMLVEEIEEAYIAIRDPQMGTLVTIIEVVSPTNKVPSSAGRMSYIAKRRDTLSSHASWVEIDLLRAGQPTCLNPEMRGSHYRILISRGPEHVDAGFWRFSVRDELPTVGIPLKGKDPDVPLALGEILQSAYERGGWDGRVDYKRPSNPPLEGADATWAKKLLRTKKLR